MHSTGLEAIFKKNKTFRKNSFSKNIFESDKYAHKPENPLSQPQILGALILMPEKREYPM